MAAPGASPRLMSPTAASRSGLTVMAVGRDAPAPGTRARTSRAPGLARARPRTRKSPCSSDEAEPADRHGPPSERVSSRSLVPSGAPEPDRLIQPPGATTRLEDVTSKPASPGAGEPDDPSDASTKSRTPTAEPSARRATRRSRVEAGRNLTCSLD